MLHGTCNPILDKQGFFIDAREAEKNGVNKQCYITSDGGLHVRKNVRDRERGQGRVSRTKDVT